jgi:hypothetical protein
MTVHMEVKIVYDSPIEIKNVSMTVHIEVKLVYDSPFESITNYYVYDSPRNRQITVGEFFKIRNCGTSEKKIGIVGLIYISRFGIMRLIFLEYFQIRNCGTYF